MGKYTVIIYMTTTVNPLKMKRRLLYLKTQSVPRCKHFSSRLFKKKTVYAVSGTSRSFFR